MPNGGEANHMALWVSNYSDMVIYCGPGPFPDAASYLYMRLYDRTAWDEKGSDAEPLLVIHGAELEALLDFFELSFYRQVRIAETRVPHERRDINAKFDH